MAENSTRLSRNTPQCLSPKVAFISGPLDPDDEYFDRYYRPKIDAAIDAGHSCKYNQ
jgi:hypothetical protein